MTDPRRPMRAGRRAAVAVLATALVLVAATATWAASAWKARAWFDAPLPGAVLPLAPYPVVLHAADDSGVARVRWLVDSVPAETQEVNGPDLATVNWLWEPASLGQHMLTAVVEGKDGSFSDPVSVGVTISAEAEAQPTPDLSPSLSPLASPTTGASATPRPGSATPGPTATARPTVAPTPVPTPCPVLSPNLTSPYVYEIVYVNPPTLVWTRPENDCPATSYHILVAEDWQFTALLVDEYVAGDTTFWDPPSPLPETPTCQYFWLVRAIDGDGNEIQEAETSAFTVDAVRDGC